MSDDEAHRFGRRMAEARDARGMTQPQLAETLGKGGSVSAIQKWERGENLPKPGMRARIRAALEMGGDDEGEETRASYPRRVVVVQETLGDLLSSLPPEELRRWRRAFIQRIVQGRRTPVPGQWPDDVEVINELLGGYLVQMDYDKSDDGA